MDQHTLEQRLQAKVNDPKRDALVSAMERKLHSLSTRSFGVTSTNPFDGGSDSPTTIQPKPTDNSFVGKMGLDPTVGLGYAANLGASLVSGAARVGGQLASLPASIGAMHDSSQLNDTHYQAYDRYQQGTATEQDMDLLQSNIYDDGRADTKNFMQAIESANNKRELARDIAERFDISSIVSNENRRGISEDLSNGFGESWGKVKEGWNGGEYGKVATGLGELALNAGSAVANNKMGVAEYIVENTPQLAVGAFGKVGYAAMAASNAGYAADEYNKGIIKHQK